MEREELLKSLRQANAGLYLRAKKTAYNHQNNTKNDIF